MPALLWPRAEQEGRAEGGRGGEAIPAVLSSLWRMRATKIINQNVLSKSLAFQLPKKQEKLLSQPTKRVRCASNCDRSVYTADTYCDMRKNDQERGKQ